jgi:hypothetical protein
MARDPVMATLSRAHRLESLPARGSVGPRQCLPLPQRSPKRPTLSQSPASSPTLIASFARWERQLPSPKHKHAWAGTHAPIEVLKVTKNNNMHIMRSLWGESYHGEQGADFQELTWAMKSVQFPAKSPIARQQEMGFVLNQHVDKRVIPAYKSDTDAHCPLARTPKVSKRIKHIASLEKKAKGKRKKQPASRCRDSRGVENIQAL